MSKRTQVAVRPCLLVVSPAVISGMTPRFRFGANRATIANRGAFGFGKMTRNRGDERVGNQELLYVDRQVLLTRPGV